MKKLLTTLILGASVLTLAACNEKDSNNNPTNPTNPSNPDTKEINFTDMYSYSAISAVNMLSSNGAVSQTRDMSMRNKDLTEAEKQKVLDNLVVVENLIAGNISTSKPENSDREEFEVMYSVNVPQIDGTFIEYKYYYNELPLLNTLDDDLDDEDDNDFDDDDDFDDDNDDNDNEFEDEKEYLLEGIVIVNQQTYQMTGKREVEVEGKEIEESMEFKISLDDKNFVTIEQEQETGEQGFEVAEYQDGKKIYETEIEFEYNQTKGEYEVSLEEKTNNGKREYEFEFYDTQEGKFVEVKIKENKEVIKAYLKYTTLEDGSFGYIFIDKIDK